MYNRINSNCWSSEGSYPFLKALLVEKPVAKTRNEAIELQNLANQHNITLLVGHIEVYNPIVLRLLEIVEKGHLGEIRNIIFQVTSICAL